MPEPVVLIILSIPLIGAYAMYAIGIVVIHQASRVLNLAHGGMAMFPAFVTYAMWDFGVPLGFAVSIGVILGSVLGVGIERIFVRRLRRVSTTAQTVGTVAALGLMVALAGRIWGPLGTVAPNVFPEGSVTVGASDLRYGQIGIFVVALAAAALFFALLHGTPFGLALRAAAQNRTAAALMGINPDLAASAAWALGGGLAALAGILLAPVTTLSPTVLALSVLPAFVAALIGGLESLPGTLVGSAVVGALLGLVPTLADLPVLQIALDQQGATELTLAAVAIAAMARRGERLSVSDVGESVL